MSLLARIDRSVIFTSNQEDVDRRHLWRVALEGGRPQALTKGETMEWRPVETGAEGKEARWFASVPARRFRQCRYRCQLARKRNVATEALPKDFPSDQLVEPQTVTFKSEDGLEIHGQLFVPPGRASPARR